MTDYHFNKKRLSNLILAFQWDQLILNWTGGVPPFRLQRTSDLRVPAWTELGSDLSPPLTLPTAAEFEFFRVVGQ